MSTYSLAQGGLVLTIVMQPNQVLNLTFWFSMGYSSPSNVQALGYLWMTEDGSLPAGLTAYSPPSVNLLENLVSPKHFSCPL